MILWKILYGTYDVGALIIMVIGLGLHALAERSTSRREGRDDPSDR